MSDDRTITAQPRSPERLRAHYEIERQLADRLHAASKESRGRLYSEIYDELFKRVTDHPQTHRSEEDNQRRLTRAQRLIKRWLKPDTVYMEVGAGECLNAMATAQLVSQVYAIDVSDAITKSAEPPANFELLLTDGVSIPVPEQSVDLAFSDQLMEHLHPDDAYEQLSNIYRALKPGGAYLCLTPSCRNGPHDVSRGFDRQAAGLHLKEYDYKQLISLFRKVGFKRIDVLIGSQGRCVAVPGWLGRCIEMVFTPLTSIRAFRYGRVAAALFGIKVLAYR